MWEIQSGKFVTSKNMNVDIFLPEFSGTKIVTWKCHIDNSTNGRYDMILGRYLITALEVDLNFPISSNLAEKDHMKGVQHLRLT